MRILPARRPSTTLRSKAHRQAVAPAATGPVLPEFLTDSLLEEPGFEPLVPLWSCCFWLEQKRRNRRRGRSRRCFLPRGPSVRISFAPAKSNRRRLSSSQPRPRPVPAGMSGIGATPSVRRVPAIVSFLNPQQTLSLGGGNRSSCPTRAVRNTRRDRLNWVVSRNSISRYSMTSVAPARSDGGSASAPSSATARRASPMAELSVSGRPQV